MSLYFPFYISLTFQLDCFIPVQNKTKNTFVWNCEVILIYMGFTAHDDMENVVEIHTEEEKWCYLR